MIDHIFYNIPAYPGAMYFCVQLYDFVRVHNESISNPLLLFQFIQEKLMKEL